MFSRIQAWNSYMIGLFIQKSHFHPYSIHSRFANEKIFCLLCLQVKIRKLTRDQLSSKVRFNSTELFWFSLVMKVEPSLTFLIFLVGTTTKYFPVCVPLFSYCDGWQSTILWILWLECDHCTVYFKCSGIDHWCSMVQVVSMSKPDVQCGLEFVV